MSISVTELIKELKAIPRKQKKCPVVISYDGDFWEIEGVNVVEGEITLALKDYRPVRKGKKETLVEVVW